jgi:hypothetical protein
VHGRSGEQAPEAPSIEIRETGDNGFGERLDATARLRLSSSSLIYILFVRLGDFDLYHGDVHGGVAVAVPTFPIALYMLLISHLALVLVPFAYLLDVLVCLHVVKLTSAYILLTSVIKLPQKLLNILKIQKKPYYMIRQFSLVGFAAALKSIPFMGCSFQEMAE